MNKQLLSFLLFCQLSLAITTLPFSVAAGSTPEAEEEEEAEKGPNRGRMLRADGFAIELAMFESGVPPEYRVWATKDDSALSPTSVDLTIKLTRLGGVVDDINFSAEGAYLRGDALIYEPHSFMVTVEARHQNKTYRWEYDSFEGRTFIEEKIAQAMHIQTEIAGEATLHQTIKVYGKLVLPANAKRKIRARFDGEIKQVHVALGETVKKGQLLLTIESNESLQSYQVTAPISGVISKQQANSGEQTAGQELLQITNTSELLAELAVFPMDVAKVKQQAPVTISVNGLEQTFASRIDGQQLVTRDDQARLFWVKTANPLGHLSEGQFVSGLIEVSTFTVPLAVKRSGLQSFRDFTVVFAKIGEQYEVRMLELGREAGEWVEVLGGLDLGTRYVSQNSYIIKADIEKSGASHDH